MRRQKVNFACVTGVTLGAGATLQGQDGQVPAEGQEAALLAVLKSNRSEKDKADACLQLARVGTKASVGPLAALLGDEKLSHMARYALEPIPDSSVDDALREAAGHVEGRNLVGVIGSIGARRDVKAADLLCQHLTDHNADTAQAAARALGSLGTDAASKALEEALTKSPEANRQAVYEGLFRCAEVLADRGQPVAALAIYDRLDQPQSPRQVRDGAAHRARMLRQEKGQTI